MLLLDEPTGDLDSKNTSIVMDILLRLNVESRITLVMVTHDVNMKYYSHRVLKVLDGKIIGEELIDPNVRTHHLANLRATISSFDKPAEESEVKENSVVERKVETYGAIKWLREKQIRDKVEREMIAKVKEELDRLDLRDMAGEVVEQIEDLV
jgi:ABC-type methionine transport system ATPase subunit